MRNKIVVLGIAFAAFGLAGCKSDAQKICDKMKELAEKEAKGDDKEKKASDEDMKKCVDELTKKGEKEPERLKKLATCMDGASNMEGAMKCMMEDAKADMEKAKEGDDKKE